MTFSQWNRAIAAHFFRPENAGRSVYLYTTRQTVDDIGAATGESSSDFVAAMKAGPPGPSRAGLCQRALQTLANWRGKEFEYPPYVGYLALFVLAAGLEGDFASHAYYPRLRELLGEP